MEQKNRFRGLVKGLGKINRWAYGGIFYISKRAFIVTDDVEIFEGTVNSSISDFIEVIPETVGQYIGLRDKKKVEIYEGDKYRRYQPLARDSKQFWKRHIEIVGDSIEDRCRALCLSNSTKGIEVIGNIHEGKLREEK